MKPFNKKKIILYAGIIFSIYSLVLSFVIQIFIIPKFFPQFDLGDGIAILDSSGFNNIAKQKSVEILNKGWSAWELRPDYQSPAGIASFFYTILIPKPISMLPFNAVIHAISGCLIIWLLSHIYSLRASVFGATLFIVNPQSLQWVAAIHRDGFFILGNLLVITSIVYFADKSKNFKLNDLVYCLLSGIIGTCLIWIARPYFLQIIILYTIIALLSIFIINLIYDENIDIIKNLKYTLLFFICLFYFQSYIYILNSDSNYNINEFSTAIKINDSDKKKVINNKKMKITKEESKEESTEILNKNVNRELIENRKNILNSENHHISMDDSIDINYRIENKEWDNSGWLHDFVEKKLYKIYITRNGAINTGGYTVIDKEIHLNNAEAFIKYLPRALQIGFLSPFPNLWWNEASTPVMTFARKIIGITTFFCYILFFFLFIGVFTHRKNLILWLLLSFGVLGITVYTYAYPNIGTLLRFRYGFYMLVIGMGAAFTFDIIRNKMSK